MILFAEKILSSNGPHKIFKEMGNTRFSNGATIDLLVPFKNYYPSHFKVVEDKKNDFFNALNDDSGF